MEFTNRKIGMTEYLILLHLLLIHYMAVPAASRFVAPAWVLPRVLSRGISAGVLQKQQQKQLQHQLQQHQQQYRGRDGGNQTTDMDVRGPLRDIVSSNGNTYASVLQFEELDGPLFARLRRRFGFSDALYASLVAAEGDFAAVPDTQSKGGQQILRLRRGGILFKTLNHAESRALRSTLTSYIQHVGLGLKSGGSVATSDNDRIASTALGSDATSALVGLLGLYRLRFPGGACLDLVAMRDVAPTGCYDTGAGDGEVCVVIKDIKGSTVGRRSKNATRLVKDLDVVVSDTPIFQGLGAATRDELLRLLERDASFLASRGLIDYSLLVVQAPPQPLSQSGTSEVIDTIDFAPLRTVNITEALMPSSALFSLHFWRRRACDVVRTLLTRIPSFSPSSANRRGAQTLPGARIIEDRGRLCIITPNATYYVAIIDYLQPYSLRKRLEGFLKGLWWDAGQVSCTDPVRYATRLLAFTRLWTHA